MYVIPYKYQTGKKDTVSFYESIIGEINQQKWRPSLLLSMLTANGPFTRAPIDNAAYSAKHMSLLLLVHNNRIGVGLCLLQYSEQT